MSATRALYIVQGSLQVWTADRHGVRETLCFADSEKGRAEFDRYIASSASQQSLIVVDVIEEMFAVDSVPNLHPRDRASLLARRVQRKFARTPYRLAVLPKSKAARGADRDVVYSAIANQELLDPWLAILLRHQTPLIGIYSVPLMAPAMLARLVKGVDPVLFVTPHQGKRLRQVFVQNGMVTSARLTQAPDIDDEGWARAVVTEIQRSRRYLERSRLVSAIEQLDVCMIADREAGQRIADAAEVQSPMQLHFVEPKTAARKLHAGREIAADRLESLYVAHALQKTPKHNYARSGENRFWRMTQLRRAVIGSCAAAAAVCSVFAGLYFGEAWRLQREAKLVDAQVSQLSEAFLRENDNNGPIEANSYAMKLAVDTGDFILEQRVPVPWVMQQLGSVLGEYPDVQVRQLAWNADAVQSEAPGRQRPGDAPLPVPIPALSSVSVDLHAVLEPFDGDMREAFARIDRLVQDIADRTSFSNASAIEYPLDARPASSVSGEISRSGQDVEAHFRLRLVYPLTETGPQMNGDHDA